MTAPAVRIDVLTGCVWYDGTQRPRFELFGVSPARPRRRCRPHTERPDVPCVVCSTPVPQPWIGRPRTHCDTHASGNARWYRRHHKVTLAADAVRAGATGRVGT